MSRQWQLNEQIISNTDYIHPYTSIYRIVPMQHVLDTSNCRGVTVPAKVGPDSFWRLMVLQMVPWFTFDVFHPMVHLIWGRENNEYRLRSSLNVCGWRVYTARSSWELFATVFFNYLGNVCKNPCVRYFMFSSQTCFSTSWYCCGLPNTLNVRSLSTRWDRKATLGWVDASTCWWYPKFYQPIFMRCVLVWFPRCSF